MGRQIKTWLLLTTLFFILSSVGYFYYRFKDQMDVLGESTTYYYYNGIPYISSVAPEVAYLGEQYVYNIALSDIDTPINELEITLLESPDWLHLNENKVVGIPTTTGTYKFVLEVSDGVNSSKQINFVLVSENE
jgi:hypothetical protein